MEIVRRIGNKVYKYYFVAITIVYIVLSTYLPNDIYAIITIPYIFLGPILFFGLIGAWELTLAHTRRLITQS